MSIVDNIKKLIPQGSILYDMGFSTLNNMMLVKRLLKGEKRLNIRYSEEKESKYSFLMIVYWDEEGIITLSQCINELVSKSKYRIDLLNVRKGFPKIHLKDVQGYDGIIIHNTIAYSSHYYHLINQKFPSRYCGIKILFKQDENHMTDKLLKFVKKQKFDLILTIWDVDTAKKVYRDSISEDTEFMQYLTGYVPSEYKLFDFCSDNRRYDVGYRGSVHPATFGTLCYEKEIIGKLFIDNTRKYDLKMNISSAEEDRIMGDKWLEFIGDCRAVLGTESGSWIVDIDGAARKSVRRYMRKNKNASKEDIVNFLKKYEQGIHYCAISPRHFEAAACRTLQVMFEGEFQGIFKPWIHYVPLKRDFSNIEEVIACIRDDKRRKEITDNAFRDIILNDDYSFDAFVRKYDEKVDCIIRKRNN